MINEIEQKLAAIATELRQAKRVLFITGAGISADGGLPTYRGVGGLYNTETTEEGYSIEQCLTTPSPLSDRESVLRRSCSLTV